MKNILFKFVVLYCFLFFAAGTVQGQCINSCSHDSLWTVCLAEVKIAPGSGDGDPVLNFYRPNKSFTTEDILSRVPALSLTRRSSFGQEPGIRALSGSRINVTLDGMKMFGACTDKMDPVSIYVEPQNLESFEVGTGACGAEHGSTFGGSLNMKLKDPDFNDDLAIKGLFGSTYHSVANSIFAFGGLDVSDKRWAAKLNAVYRKSHNYNAGGGEAVQFSAYEKNNLSASLKYLLSSNQTLKLDFLTDNGYKIGFPALTMDVRYAHARIGSMSWNYSSKASLIREAEIKVYSNTIRHMMDDRDRKGLLMHMDMPGSSKTNGANLNLNFYLLKNVNVYSKVDYYSNTLFAEMFMYPEGGRMMYMQTLPETKRQVGGIYISPVWQIDSLNKLTLGGRWDLSSTKMSDELGLAQLRIFYPDTDSSFHRNIRSAFLEYERRLSTRFVAGVQIGWSERLPSPQEMFGFYLYNRLDGFDYIGNPELRNEIASQYSFSLSYETKQWNVSLSPFLTMISHYIEGVPDGAASAMTEGANGVKLYDNTGDAILKGSELSIKYNAASGISLMSTGKFVHGQRDSGEPMWQIPPFKSLTSIKYRLGLYSIQAESELSARQNRINPASGETKTPSYILFHLRLSAVWMLGPRSIELNGGVENITDRFYHEHLDWSAIPRPGRNFYLTVAFRF